MKIFKLQPVLPFYSACTAGIGEADSPAQSELKYQTISAELCQLKSKSFMAFFLTSSQLIYCTVCCSAIGSSYFHVGQKSFIPTMWPQTGVFTKSIPVLDMIYTVHTHMPSFISKQHWPGGQRKPILVCYM